MISQFLFGFMLGIVLWLVGHSQLLGISLILVLVIAARMRRSPRVPVFVIAFIIGLST